MKAGKVGVKKLSNTVLNQITHYREDVIVGAGIGEDSAVVDFGDESLVISSDPITGAAENAGYLAVNVACNDIASTGAVPVGIEVVLLLPTNFPEQKTISLMKEINQSAKEINVEILGGHTEVLDLVSAPLIVVTAIGRVKKDKHISTASAQNGDNIILTKGAGIEGTYILGNDFSELLEKKGIKKSLINNVKSYKRKISVINEGKIAADNGANALHDVTEGGVYGAVEEMALASGLGFEIYKDQVIINEETDKICKALDLDPLGLISSGSMLIAVNNGEQLVNKLNSQGIKASVIGKFREKGNYIVNDNGKKTKFKSKNQDELWRFLENN